MKHRVAIALAVVTVALAATGSAFAFDCMRVSSSMEGLQQSTAHSGNWLYFDMTPAGTGIEHFDDTVVPVFEAAAPTCLGL
jgi:hypothetical protein